MIIYIFFIAKKLIVLKKELLYLISGVDIVPYANCYSFLCTFLAYTLA